MNKLVLLMFLMMSACSSIKIERATKEEMIRDNVTTPIYNRIISRMHEVHC